MENKQPALTITRLPGGRPLVIKQEEGASFFITSKNSIIIDPSGLVFLIKFLVQNNIISYKVLIGILEEYNSD